MPAKIFSIARMFDSKPLIVVTGATGQQGGSVAKFLLEDGSFKIRGTTRNVESTKAKGIVLRLSPSSPKSAITLLLIVYLELAAKGVEVVQADFDDLESLKKAFKGAYGVFGMTDCKLFLCMMFKRISRLNVTMLSLGPIWCP